MTRLSIRPAALGGLALASVAAAVVAVSCTGGGDAGKGNARSPGAGTGAATQAQQTSSPPLATVRGDIAGLVLQVREVRRDPAGTVTARFVLANSGAESVVGGSFGDFTTRPQRPDLSGAYLFDGAKRYHVVKDGDECVCSNSPGSIEPGQQTEELFVTFPSPGADVDRVSLVILHFPPVDGIELPG